MNDGVVMEACDDGSNGNLEKEKTRNLESHLVTASN